MPDHTDIEIAAAVRADIAIVEAGASGAAHTLWIDGRAYIISVELARHRHAGPQMSARFSHRADPRTPVFMDFLSLRSVTGER